MSMQMQNEGPADVCSQLSSSWGLLIRPCNVLKMTCMICIHDMQICMLVVLSFFLLVKEIYIKTLATALVWFTLQLLICILLVSFHCNLLFFCDWCPLMPMSSVFSPPSRLLIWGIPNRLQRPQTRNSRSSWDQGQPAHQISPIHDRFCKEKVDVKRKRKTKFADGRIPWTASSTRHSLQTSPISYRLRTSPCQTRHSFCDFDAAMQWPGSEVKEQIWAAAQKGLERLELFWTNMNDSFFSWRLCRQQEINCNWAQQRSVQVPTLQPASSFGR